jgi:hypothetical protein
MQLTTLDGASVTTAIPPVQNNWMNLRFDVHNKGGEIRTVGLATGGSATWWGDENTYI